MTIKHIVFDWDGTLADTYQVISTAYNHAFETLGLPPMSYDEIKRITSTVQNKDTLSVLYGDKKEEARLIFYNYIEKHHTDKLKTMPQAKEFLEFCHQSGFQLYLLTNKTRRYIMEELEGLGLTGFFTKIVAAGDFSEDKPHPIATHAVFPSLPKADSILVIGDGVADYESARTYDHGNARALCIIYDPKEKYHGEQPDKIVKDFSEIITFLKDTNANV